MKAKGLGRRLSIDLRDNNYKLPDLRRMAILETKKLWSPGTRLDQGNTPQCVGFGTYKLFTMGPVVNKPKISPSDIYHEAQKLDEWEGEDYEGTSVRAGLEVGRKLGMIAEYRWSSTVEMAIPWLLAKGPLIAGTIWVDSMFDPWTTRATRDGKRFEQYTFVNVDRNSQFDLAGGHCYCLNGVDKLLRCPDGTTGAIRIINSWGNSWGDSGEVWISFADFDVLMKYAGELASVTEI
jgi:hypothetical protein